MEMADTPEEGVQGEEVEAFFGTYKTKEDAEAGEKARSDKISQQGQALKDRDAEIASLRNNTALLEKLTEKVTAKPEAERVDPQAEVDAMVDKIADAYEAGDFKTVARLQLQINSGWVGQSEEQLKAEMKSQADTLGITVKTLEKRLADQDPEMLAHGDAAKEFAKQAGVELSAENRDLFLNLAKANATTNQPERADLPGGVVSTRVVGGSESDSMTEEEWLIIGDGKVPTDKEKAALKKQWSKKT